MKTVTEILQSYKDQDVSTFSILISLANINLYKKTVTEPMKPVKVSVISRDNLRNHTFLGPLKEYYARTKILRNSMLLKVLKSTFFAYLQILPAGYHDDKEKKKEFVL